MFSTILHIVSYNMLVTGILIDIEGGDGSGKATQAKLLTEALQGAGRDVETFSFPRYYESRSGKLIGELLAGKHGDFMTIPPYVSALPYAMDRASAKDDLRAALDAGKVVICDRYTSSNLAHQSAKLPKDEQDALVDFIEGLEYGDLGIPKPDIVFYLSVPTDISSDLITKKDAREYTGGEKRDQAERNIAHQDRTRAAYLKLAGAKGWHVIDCVKDGILRTPDDIHKEVYAVVKERL
jgi:dTMP kinase